MKLSDLYRTGSTYNWQKPEDSKWDMNGKKSSHDKAPLSSILYAKYDNNATDIEPMDLSDGKGEYMNPDPLSFRNDNSPDDYSEIHDETESSTAVAFNLAPELRVRGKKMQDPGHTETPSRAQTKRGKHGIALPSRSGNQHTPPSKIRHRKFMGIPDNLGPGIN